MKDEGRLPKGNYKKDKIKVFNPKIKYNGRYWYLSLGLEMENKKLPKLSKVSCGVDLGIRTFAVVSNLEKPFKNINKTREMKRLNKKLKRLQKNFPENMRN